SDQLGAPEVPDTEKEEQCRRRLHEQIARASIVLLLFDKHYESDFQIASQALGPPRYYPDWVREEIEYALKLNKEIILVYGVAGIELQSKHVWIKLQTYIQIRKLIPALLKCESRLVEFSIPGNRERQLAELSLVVKNRLLNYWRFRTTAAVAYSRRLL